MALITVFTSCFNHAQYLSEAIESVLSQTFTDFEYLLYDDGSTDNTWKIIQNYAKQDKRIRATKLLKASSVAPILNLSVKEAKGRFWTWCPADDIWKKDLLEKKLKFSQECNHKSVIYSDFQIVDQDNNFVSTVKCPSLSQKEFADIVWKQSPIGFTGIWIPLSVFNDVGLFPENLYFSEDFYWMIKATIHGVHFQRLSKVLYSKRKHLNSTTARNSKQMAKQIDTIRNELRKYAQKRGNISQ